MEEISSQELVDYYKNRLVEVLIAHENEVLQFKMSASKELSVMTDKLNRLTEDNAELIKVAKEKPV